MYTQILNTARRTAQLQRQLPNVNPLRMGTISAEAEATDLDKAHSAALPGGGASSAALFGAWAEGERAREPPAEGDRNA